MIRLIVDSSSDMTKKEAEELNLIYLPIELEWDGKIYLDGIELYGDAFYEKLVSTPSIPRTSQVKISLYEEVFDKVCDNNDEAIVIVASSKLSGGYQSAVLAAKERSNIVVIDSETASLGEYVLIKLAYRLIQEGKSLKEIQEVLEKEKKKIVVLAALDTVTYLQKGGRLSTAVALVANLIKIKPVLRIQDGEAKLVGKARGIKKAGNYLDQTLEEMGGIDLSLPFAVGYSGIDPTNLKNYLQAGKEKYHIEFQSSQIIQAGASIGTHTGPDALILGVFGNR